ncbi:hypothetical protein ACFSQE_13495 [Vogesella fluminis]|uniref:hypothetical protein n=1 Tax=Vogesella fluminis TaxID=1069161 RepID=UPI0036389DB0
MSQTRQLSRDEIKTLPLFPALGPAQITVVDRAALPGRSRRCVRRGWPASIPSRGQPFARAKRPPART